jgi:hypothetical protein
MVLDVHTLVAVLVNVVMIWQHNAYPGIYVQNVSVFSIIELCVLASLKDKNNENNIT